MPAESPDSVTIKWWRQFVTDKKLLRVKLPQLITKGKKKNIYIYIYIYCRQLLLLIIFFALSGYSKLTEYLISKVKWLIYIKTFFIESDHLPDRRVRTEENSYCEDDCRVLNEGKLFGCLTVVYSKKENFLGTRLSCPD